MTNFYKKQVEIAREFGVSEGTVSNWINGAEEGKNNLQLIDSLGKQKIIKNEHNRVEMLNLADNGKKFRPDDDTVELVVKDELYDMMSENQIISLINSLMLNHDIPLKYAFLGHGGELWDEFYNETQVGNFYGASALNYLLQKSFSFLEGYFKNFDYVNLIDVGSGNAAPAVELIKYLHTQKKLNKYIAIDISKSILDITRANVSQIISDEQIVTHQQDIEIESFQDILYKYKNFNQDKKTVNIVLFLGGVIGNTGSLQNQIKVLMNVRDGLFPDDYIIVSDGLDIISNRITFPTVDIQQGNNHVMFLTKLLGITKDMFSAVKIFDSETEIREYKLVLNCNVNINFKRLNKVLRLEKNTKITVWKHRRDTFESITSKMKASGMGLEYISKHPHDPIVLYMGKTL